MESTQNKITQEDKTALSQLQQKASNLRQSSSNHFLVALEGLMLAAIAWESIGKEGKPIISALSKGTTAIGLAVTGLFTYNAMADRNKAAQAETKLKKYGFDEFTLPSEVPTVAAPVAPLANQPATTILAQGIQATPLQTTVQELAV